MLVCLIEAYEFDINGDFIVILYSTFSVFGEDLTCC